jgi:hypothetical protein
MVSQVIKLLRIPPEIPPDYQKAPRDQRQLVVSQLRERKEITVEDEKRHPGP